MKIKYAQKQGLTFARFEGKKRKWTGLARMRPGDSYDPSLGLAVALLKAEQAFIPNSSQDTREWERVFNGNEKLETFNMNDDDCLAWTRLWHECRLALAAVQNRRNGFQEVVFESGSFRVPLMKKSRIPSDGEIIESFGLRLLNETNIHVKA